MGSRRTTGDQIFISYRRAGGDTTAKLICETLKGRGYTVFYDFDTLKGGYFDTRILSAIEACNDMVLVLPPNALDRCENENDWVRQEIRYALQKGKNIIPVMLDGFTFPSTLPSDIEAISRYNGLHFSMEYFDAAIGKIIEKLSPNTKCSWRTAYQNAKKARAKVREQKDPFPLLSFIKEQPFFVPYLVLSVLFFTLALTVEGGRHAFIGALIGCQYIYWWGWIRRWFSGFDIPRLYACINAVLLLGCIPLICFSPALRTYGIVLASSSALSSFNLFLFGAKKRREIEYCRGGSFQHGELEYISLLTELEAAVIVLLVAITLTVSGVWAQRLFFTVSLVLASALLALLGYLANNADPDADMREKLAVFYMLLGLGFTASCVPFLLYTAIALYVMMAIQLVFSRLRGAAYIIDDTATFAGMIGGSVFLIGITIGIIVSGVSWASLTEELKALFS